MLNHPRQPADLKDMLGLRQPPPTAEAHSTTAPELLNSLGRVVRGLSALFWGLPISLVVCVQTATGNWFHSLGVVPPLLATGLLFYGLLQLGHFHKRERVWQRALDRTRIFALVNVGLAPFLFWWSEVPGHAFYQACVLLMLFSGLLFLFTLNPVLRCLAAMLPDETLRQETRAFTALNRFLLFITLLVISASHGLARLQILPGPLSPLHLLKERIGLWLILFLVLMPLAMTMALLWKIKEVILTGVFGGDQ
jgi:hypothetical protein